MLRLTLNAEGDGTGELIVEASRAGFCGASSAWFEVGHLEAFAANLEAYPLPKDTPPRLEGGYWQDGTVIERHVGLTFRQIDLRGTVGIQVELATPLHEGDRPESQSRSFVEIRTDYASLHRFAVALRRLAQGSAEEACLEGDASAK